MISLEDITAERILTVLTSLATLILGYREIKNAQLRSKQLTADTSKVLVDAAINLMQPQDRRIEQLTSDLNKVTDELRSCKKELEACRIQMEEAINEIKEYKKEIKYKNVFDSMRDIAFIVDVKSLKIIDANQMSNEITGYTIDELKEMKLTDVISCEKGVVERAIKNRLTTLDFANLSTKEKSVIVKNDNIKALGHVEGAKINISARLTFYCERGSEYCVVIVV
jgi:PAS domain S-box-containing protein